MKPSIAACITPNGSLLPPDLPRSQRPMKCPPAVAAITTTNKISVTAKVLSWKKTNSPPFWGQHCSPRGRGS